MIDFTAIVKRYNAIVVVGLVGVAVTPLADYFIGIGSPWPAFAAALTSAANFIVLILATASWESLSKKRLAKRVRGYAGLAGVFMIAYVSVYSLFVTSYGPDSIRLVTGYALRDDATKTIESIRETVAPSYDADDALRDSQYVPEKVWTKTSLLVTRVGILSSWLGFFIAFAACVAAFALSQERFVKGPDPDA